MKKYISYLIFVILLVLIILGFYKLMFNFDGNVSIAEDLITKVINNSFTEKEKKLEGVSNFYTIINNQEEKGILLSDCTIYKINNYERFVDLSKYSEDECGADFDDIIFSAASKNVINVFISDKISSDIKYNVIDNDIEVNLSDFEFYYDYFEIEIDGVIFRINFEDVDVTFNTYINNILKKNNTFKLVNITEEVGYKIFDYKDVITGNTVKIKYIKNIFGYPKDIQIEIPSILYN